MRKECKGIVRYIARKGKIELGGKGAKCSGNGGGSKEGLQEEGKEPEASSERK